MQLKSHLVVIAIAVTVAAAWAVTAEAQSLSPMRKHGTTPTEIKGFRLTVGNPYDRRMTFIMTPMEPGFETAAGEASVTPAMLTLAPGESRQVILAFRIPEAEGERTIGLCITPRDIEGPILPRVCGTYSGNLLIRSRG
jgi:hypothetical protein